MPTTFAFDEVEPAKSEFGFDEVQPAGTEERSLTGKLADLPGKAFDEAIKWGGLGMAGRSLAYALGGPEALKTGEEVVKEVTSKPLVDVPSKAVESMLGVSQYLLPKDVKEGLGEAGKSVFDFLLSPKGAAMTVGAALVPEVGLPAFVAQGELALPDAMEAVRRAESTKEKTAALGNLATTVATILGPVAGGGAARPSPGMEIVPRTRPFRPPRPGPGYVIDVTPLLEEGMQPPQEPAALPGTQRPLLPAPGRHVEVTPEGVAADVMQMSPEEHAAFLTATARRGRPPEPRPAVRAGAIAPEALDAGIWEIVSDDALSPVDKFKAIQRIRQQAGNRVYPAEPPIADVFQEPIGGTEPPPESGPAVPVEPASKPTSPAPEAAPEPQPAAPAAQPEAPSIAPLAEGGKIMGMKPQGEKEGHYVVIKPELPEDQPMMWGPFEDRKSAQTFIDAEVGADPSLVSIVEVTKKGAPDAKVQKPEAGPLPPVEREPAVAGAEVQAEAGAAQRSGQGPKAPGAQARDVVLKQPESKNPWNMTFDELKDFLSKKATSHEGLYELENLYESKVGERAPRNSGELVDFLAEHYDKYPDDLREDFQPIQTLEKQKELPKPKAIDYQDRDKVPGEHYRAKPNSIVIQFRGLDTEPLKTGQPFELKFTGDLKKAGRDIMQAFRQAREQGLDFSYRETPVIATDAKGNAIYHFKVNPAEGTVSATTHAQMLEARKQYRKMTGMEETAEPTGFSKAKQPWEMTADEFESGMPEAISQAQYYFDTAMKLKRKGSIGETNIRDWLKKKSLGKGRTALDVWNESLSELEKNPEYKLTHREWVERAIKEGKPVPPEVLEDYPDLAEKAPQGVTPPAEPSRPATTKGAGPTGTPETKAPNDVTAPISQKVPERLMIKPRTDGMVSLEDYKGARLGTFKTVDEAAKAASDLGYTISPGSPLKPNVTAPISKPKSAREAAEDIAKKLDELKAPTDRGTMNLFGVTNVVWNAAVDAAKAIVRAGGTIADAIDAAIGYMARNIKGAWNQVGARNYLNTVVTRLQQQAVRLSNIDNIIGAERLANAPEGVRKTARWVEDHIRGFAWRIANKDPLFQVGSDLNGAQSNATMFTKKVFNDVNNAFLRAIGQSVFEKPYTVLRPWLNKFKTQGTALSFIVESGSDLQQLIFERDMLRMRQWDNAWADKVRQSDWLANKNEALKAYDYAIDNFNSLRPVADFYRSAMDNQIRSEWSNGIETPYRQNYVMHPAEVAGDLGIFGTAGGGAVGSPRFNMQRTYASFFDGLMNGQTYRTMDGIQTLQQRVYAGMHRILSKQWLEGMRNMTDANGNPLVKDMNPNVITRPVQQFYTNAQGRQVPQASHGWFIQYRNINGVRTPVEARIEFEAPAGYSKFDWHGQPMAVLKGFDTYLHAFTDPSIFARSVPGRAIMNLASTGKHLILQGDIFHMNRLGIWGSAFQMKPSGYNKGLYLMDYSLGELRRMEARGEITPDTLNFAIQNQPYLRIIQKHSGIHFGKIEDNMYSALTEHIPLTGYFNRWLFGEMQRGVMMETALYELKRQMANRPDLTTEQVAKMVGLDINTRFGTLYNQSIIKSKSFRDLARLLFLAPGWNEGLIRSEFRAAKQVATAIPDSVKAERLAIGGMAKAVGTLAVMMFAAGQAANFMTRKKPTWENEEEGFDAKLSPWIPDLTGSGPGMFISPLSLPFETSHLIAKRIERSGNFNDAFRQYAQSRLGYFSRPVVTYFTKRDVFDRPIRPEEYRKEMIRSAVPIPISGEAAWSMGKELVQRGAAAATGEQPPGTRQQFPGQYQKQILATAGMKTDSAPSPSQRINALARQFNEAHNVKTQGDFYQSKYADADRFLRIGNTTDAKTAIRDLLKEKTPKDIVDRYSKSTDYLFTRSMAREKAFIATLNQEQLQAYRQAKKDKAEVKTRFFKVWREMRESGELKP